METIAIILDRSHNHVLAYQCNAKMVVAFQVHSKSALIKELSITLLVKKKSSALFPV